MNTFAERYALLQQDVQQICQQCSRNADEVRILAVSKTFPVAAITEAYSCGVRMFGENKIQELAAKLVQAVEPAALAQAAVAVQALVQALQANIM